MKSIKKLSSKSIKNVKSVKGGADIVPIRTPRYKGDRG